MIVGADNGSSGFPNGRPKNFSGVGERCRGRSGGHLHTLSQAIAAVEVIARLKGNLGARDAHTETADNWVKAHPQQPPPDLVALGAQALDRILEPPSELLELWQESDEFDAWKKAVLDLKRRASGLTSPGAG